MEPVDVETLVTELELRVDRLRSLYEQYFMGIEKLEPGVPRKDVDRRIAIIRKEQIRNTGLRFRFLMLVQRYNTYQTHWQRICREIENGTYKRHMMRAQARFGDPAKPPPSRRKSSAPPAPSKELGVDSLPPPMSTDAAILDDEDFAAFASLEPLPTIPMRSAPKAKTYDVDMDFGDLGDPLDREPSSMRIPIATPLEKPASPPNPASFAPSEPGSASGRAWRKAAPAAPRISATPPAPAPLPAPGASPPRPPPPVLSRPPLVPPKAPPPTGARPAVSAPPAPIAKPAPPAPIAKPAPPAPIARPPVPQSPVAKPAPPPAPIARPVAPPAPIARPAAPPAPIARPPAPAAPVAKPAAPAAPIAKPPAPAPAPVARPAPPPAAAKPAAPAPRAAGDLPDERVRQLYSQYVETKRRQNESTAAITYDNLAKSLRESSAKLREKHGKAVDFEVAVKDGKTILKPVVK